MSIFKQSFPKWVKEQLELRQELQSTGFNGTSKSEAALVWNQNKQCVIRATSLVNYDENVNLDISSPNGGDEKFETLKGAELSKRFILQGGILNEGTTRNSRFGSPGSAYGDPTIGSDGENLDGYGQVPMPGITQLDVKTKSAYGSLRQAKLSFVVHNLRQLAIMELLYMRPGYPVLVEWGWSPYINNEGEIETITPHISDKIDLFKDKLLQKDIYDSIIQLKKDTFSNCDAFMGFVTNFGFQARPDGGFDCFSEIISMGEAIDTIKMRPIKSALSTQLGGEVIAFKVDETDEEIRNPDALKGLILAIAKSAGVIGTAGAEEENTLQMFEEDNSPKLMNAIFEIINNKFIKPRYPDLTPSEQQSQIGQYILRKHQTTEAGEFSAPLNAGFITWELFSFLINEIVIPKAGDKPSIEIQLDKIINNLDGTNRLEPLFYNKFTNSTKSSITDLSCDPRVCVLPHSWFDTTLQGTLGSETTAGKVVEYIGDYYEKYWRKAVNFVQSSATARAFGSDTQRISSLGTNELGEKVKEKFIGNIYLNIQMLLDAYDETIKGNNEGSLGDFINAVWDKVNEACPLHNFIFKVDDEYTNVAYVIDLPVDNEEIAEIKGEIFEVEVQSSKSIVREYSLEASIPDALKSTVAIHAQGPSNAEDVDDVTFQAFNRAISNRLYVPPPPPKTKEELEQEAKEAKEKEGELTPYQKLLKKRDSAFEDYEELKKTYFEIINYYEESSADNAEGSISDLKTALKDLQSSTLQLELMNLKSISTSAVIPLEFNLTLDGISNILIGCIFKIKEDRLPKAYRNSVKGGANVGFIVFNEEQNITAGQDWVTKIGGKMIMLPNDGTGKSFGEEGKGGETAQTIQTEKIFDQIETLPLTDPKPIETTDPQKDLLLPSPPEEDQQAIQDEVFADYVNLNRKFYVPSYTRDLFIQETWMTGTNAYTKSIYDLNKKLGLIVDEWIKLRPRVEAVFGSDFFELSTLFRDKYQKEESNKAINITINGQKRKLITEVPQLGPDTENNYLMTIFDTTDVIIEG